ncbi:HAD family phosphatase [Streptomyces sp. NPDC000594]|uniref:HAD family hydrolase n=1 Tax=Streptomyces sp. NPDC000594 TaxID=3154261 RepID=UPI00332DD9BD
MAVDTVVVDYGGVLTNPLAETFVAFAELAGIDPGKLAEAFAAATERHGITPMAALETGGITERQMAERILELLPEEAGRVLENGQGFGELWFRGRRANEPFVAYLRTLRARGYRLALLTNNVREWEPLWRAQLPVDELFEVVVDSHREGVRKPDPEIYRILLDRLAVTPERVLFVDDTAENCAAATALGIRSVLFTGTPEAIAAVDAALADGAPADGAAPAGTPLAVAGGAR